jgi:import inner membrane translocase subunit TIM50
LKAYQGKDVVLEYAKFEAEMKRKQIEQWEKSGGGKSVVSNAGGSWLSRLMGAVRSLITSYSACHNNAILTYILTFYLDSQTTRRRKMVYH